MLPKWGPSLLDSLVSDAEPPDAGDSVAGSYCCAWAVGVYSAVSEYGAVSAVYVLVGTELRSCGGISCGAIEAAE